jgi:hypothetical protein
MKLELEAQKALQKIERKVFEDPDVRWVKSLQRIVEKYPRTKTAERAKKLAKIAADLGGFPALGPGREALKEKGPAPDPSAMTSKALRSLLSLSLLVVLSAACTGDGDGTVDALRRAPTSS